MKLQIGLLVYAQEEKILKASDSLTKESSLILIFIFKFHNDQLWILLLR